VQNWEPPGGVPAGLMLHARRIVLPHPAGGTLDVSAAPPDRFAAALAALGFDGGEAEASRFEGEDEAR
jgi:23S rRNA pseudouridine955/2504/2580 synthase